VPRGLSAFLDDTCEIAILGPNDLARQG